MAEPRECVKCGRITIICGRGLCKKCYTRERYLGNLNKYPKDNRGLEKRYDYCVDCIKYSNIFGRNRCQKCYDSWFRSQPGYKEKHAKIERERRRKNPEKYKKAERRRAKTLRRQQWKKKYNKAYYQQNKDKRLEYNIQWRENNRAKASALWGQAYQRRNEADGITTEDQWQAIVNYYCPDNKCLCCGGLFDEEIITKKLSRDHVIPLNLGGTHWPDNMQPLCYSCNASKGDRHITDYRPDKGDFAKSLMV